MKKLLLSFLGIFLFTSFGFCSPYSSDIDLANKLFYGCQDYCLYKDGNSYEYCSSECNFKKDAWKLYQSGRKIEIDWKCYFDCRLKELKPKGVCRMNCDQEFQKCYSECLEYSSPGQCVMKCNPGFNIWGND